tara:strand:+ start:792 stop:1319 length:528 start_codon:yes stop_codon:yes gene_type:complete
MNIFTITHSSYDLTSVIGIAASLDEAVRKAQTHALLEDTKDSPVNLSTEEQQDHHPAPRCRLKIGETAEDPGENYKIERWELPLFALTHDSDLNEGNGSISWFRVFSSQGKLEKTLQEEIHQSYDSLENWDCDDEFRPTVWERSEEDGIERVALAKGSPWEKENPVYEISKLEVK